MTDLGVGQAALRHEDVVKRWGMADQRRLGASPGDRHGQSAKPFPASVCAALTSPATAPRRLWRRLDSQQLGITWRMLREEEQYSISYSQSRIVHLRACGCLNANTTALPTACRHQKSTEAVKQPAPLSIQSTRSYPPLSSSAASPASPASLFPDLLVSVPW
jgi:hypothetical protein